MDFFGGSNPNFFETIAAIFIASLPGIVVAFLTQYLAQRREDQNRRRLYASARRLLALEVENNRASLDAFWRTINDLDKEQQQDAKQHLAALAANGLVGYTLPHWSFSRWERMEAETYAAFEGKEIAGIDKMNRALESITDLYTALVTLTPEDKAEFMKNMDGRFWMNDFAFYRIATYEKIADAVQQVSGAPRLLVD
ncbi:MAG TPA: hypothetical protein VKT52_07625 [Ktedonobacterales bacterium]|nr:hypothetical protein [Ktedonobacterales bacterium]